MLNLSKTTISSLVEELINSHIIYEMEMGTPAEINVGRNPLCLMPVKNCNYVAVALWESNIVEMKLVDINAGVVATSHRKTENSVDYVLFTRKCFEKLLEKVNRDQVLGVCIIIPGMIDPQKNEIIATPIGINKEEGKTIIKMLRKQFCDVSVSILNDTACLTYAEMISTKIKDVDFAFINFDKGIGASLYIQNKILGGATGTHTQFGHYSLNPEGALCKCGGRGCLEVMIGEESIAPRIEKISNSNKLIQIKDIEILKSIKSITYEVLNSAAQSGNMAAIQVIHDIAYDFSQAIVNLISIVCPKMIIIGGRGKDLGEIFLNQVKENLKHMGFRDMVDSVSVIYSKSRADDCYLGAVKYYIEEYYDFTKSTLNHFYIG